MGIKFKSPLQLSAHRSIAHSDTAKTLIVKVITKTAAHPEHGNGSSSGYTIDGVEGAYLELTPGNTYKFDQSDSSNASHPLRFYEEANKTTAYTTGVTTNGTAGSSGAYTQIIPTTSTPPILFYQCSSHSLMGSYAKFGTGTIGDTYSINATQDGSNVDLNLDAASGTDSTVQLNAGSNITLTRDNANQVTIAASGGALTIQDEGSALSTAATTLNFTGDGVTASGTGATKTINVTGGSSSGTVTIEKNVYTGNGSTTTFNTSSAIANENNVQIYIDGVYQSKDNYTTSGSTVTMATAPGNGTSVELIQFVAISGNVVAVDSFTGNGSTTAFSLTLSVSNKNNTQVYIDGVYQDKSTYTISGTTLTFSPAPGNGAKIEVVHIKASSSSSTSGIEWQSSIQASNFTATAGEGYFINTTSSTITMTLPSSPSVGDTVAVVDAYFKFQTNALTLSSSDKINGATGNFLLNTVGKAVEMVYSGATRGWLVASDADGHAAEDTMEYLVVAGGGSGGNYLGGGGGAGGVRSGSFTPTSGVQYTATVGTGGAGATSQSSAAANNGGNSSLAGSGITTVSATGGGGGGSYSGGAGASGGSGGGGGIQESSGGGAAGAGNAGQYSPVEGYAGGAGKYRSAGAAYGPSGAGGGASEAGDDGLINQGIPVGGHKGGNGISSSITGSAVTYAGGGGAATYSGSTANGVSAGGTGGGGNGAGTGQPTTGGNGTDGLGGGGGGGTSQLSPTSGGKGGDGGDGVVILKVATLYYTGTTTGSPTITTSGSYTIIKFTGSGTYTH